LLGLALVASVNGQNMALSTNGGGQMANTAPPGFTALATINAWLTNPGGTQATVSPGGIVNSGSPAVSNNYYITIPNVITTLVFSFTTNQYTAQLQHRWSPNYPNPLLPQYAGNGLTALSYTCDACAGGNPISCSTSLGPKTSPSPALGWPCAQFTRTYTFSGLVVSPNPNVAMNAFAVQLFDLNPNTSSYSFQILRYSPPIVGDPQITGIQGQDFQVHGVPDEIFNMITYPNLQVNARFVYLSSGACHDNFTACFAHPGTYIAEEGIRLGKDKIHVVAGCFKKGLTVSVNGEKITEKEKTLKLGLITIVNHRRVIIKTPILSMTISNSDKFLNQETALYDQKLLALGQERKVLSAGESFHSEVPLHGLQGQTWRNVEYPSGLEYEGSISDYQVISGNLFGSDFVFNQYKQ
jgi:hypothetical protein